MATRDVAVSLPVLVDDESGQRFAMSVQMTPHESQAAHIFGDANTATASAVSITSQGFELTLAQGLVAYAPDRFDEAIEALQLRGRLPIVGAQAVAAVAAIQHCIDTLPRARGKRGPGRAGLERRDMLVAGVLVRIAEGMSWRKAVAATLDAHTTTATDTEMDGDALLAAVKRALTTFGSKTIRN